MYSRFHEQKVQSMQSRHKVRDVTGGKGYIGLGQHEKACWQIAVMSNITSQRNKL